MFDLDGIITKAVRDALEPEHLHGVIQKTVAETIDYAITSALSRHSTFGRDVAKYLEDVCRFDAAVLDNEQGAKTTHALGQFVRARIAKLNDEKMAQAVGGMLDAILQPLPPVMKLSEIVQQAVSDWSDNYGEARQGQPTVIVDDAGGVVQGYWHIYLDPEHGKHKYSCSVKFDINATGDVYKMYVSGENIGKTMFAGPHYGFEQLLFQLYTNKVKIEVDKTMFHDVYY